LAFEEKNFKDPALTQAIVEAEDIAFATRVAQDCVNETLGRRHIRLLHHSGIRKQPQGLTADGDEALVASLFHQLLPR
jgi:hypothetical protein